MSLREASVDRRNRYNLQATCIVRLALLTDRLDRVSKLFMTFFALQVLNAARMS